MTYEMERRKFTVHDRERILNFEGVLLGHASSERPGKQRWSEVSIYRTDAGNYIVSGAGKTNVRRGDIVYDDRAGERIEATQDEAPRYWAHVAETAEGAVQSLYLRDESDIKYMTHVARDALKLAARADDAIRQAFLVENVA